MIDVSVEFLFGVGDGRGTVIVGIVVALFRSWNSSYLRHYLDDRGGETEDEQDRFEDLEERMDSIEERVESIDKRVKDDGRQS